MELDPLANTKITMTLLVCNEQDIIEDNIRFHHAMGVDNFIVMDNLSTDATAKILQSLSQDIEIHYIYQPLGDFQQSRWVTEMARHAATRLNADWVISNDADEFWLPQDGTIKQVLDSVPSNVGAISAIRHNAVVIGENGAALTGSSHPERSEIFEKISLNVPGNPLPPKVLHRAFPDAVVAQGNHSVKGINGETEDAANRLRILHYPYRSLALYKSKIRTGGAAYARNTSLPANMGQTWRKHFQMLETGGVDQFWNEISENIEDIKEGLDSGRLIKENTVVEFIKQLKCLRIK